MALSDAWGGLAGSHLAAGRGVCGHASCDMGRGDLFGVASEAAATVQLRRYPTGGGVGEVEMLALPLLL